MWLRHEQPWEIVSECSNARTPPKSVACVVGTGGKFSKREDHDHVKMADGEIK